MKKTSLLLIVFFLPSLLGFAPLPASLPAAAKAAHASTHAPVFGYTTTTEPGDWIEIDTAGNDLTGLLDGTRDEGKILLDLGFPFPFFEHSYSHVDISMNGALFFSGRAVYSNAEIPLLVSPNNFIAPFWDDLTLGDESEENKNGIFVATFTNDEDCRGTAPCTVIEWKVFHFQETAQLDFQAVLFQNGNIRFNYRTLDGTINSSTVGLEDSDGVDGVQAFYNEDGLSTAQSILFTYPVGERYGVKATVRYVSGFTINNVARIPIHLVNTGDQQIGITSTYRVISDNERAGDWTVALTDAYGRPVAGRLIMEPQGSPGDEAECYLRVTAPREGVVGDYVNLEVSIAPALHEDQPFLLDVQAAIPAAFLQPHLDVDSATKEVSFIRSSVERSVFADDGYNGGGPTVSPISDFQYMYAWATQSGDYTSNIRYVITNALGDRVNVAKNLVQPQPPELANLTADRQPKVSASTNGTIAVLFDRAVYTKIPKGELSFSYDPTWNVMLALMKPKSGEKSWIDLTGNLLKATADNGPIYDSAPSIVSAGEKFYLAWQETQKSGNKSTQDLYFAIYNSAGEKLKTARKITSSVLDVSTFSDPDLTLLANGNVLMTYTYTDVEAGSHIAFQVFDSDGNQVVNQTLIPDATGNSAEAVALNDRGVVVAWMGGNGEKVQYALLDPSGNPTGMTPVELKNPTGFGVDSHSLSVTRYQGEYAILTWRDSLNTTLYYALAKYDGTLTTPPMGYRSGEDLNSSYIYVSTSGEGTAPLDIPVFRLYMPLSSRNSK